MKIVDEKTVTFSTECAGCTFYNRKKCKLGRIDKYENLGLLMMKDGEYCINDICIAKRFWDVPEEGNWSPVIHKVAKECEIQTTYVIISRSAKETKKIIKKVTSISDKYIKPKAIFIITAYANVDINNLVKEKIDKIIVPQNIYATDDELLDTATDKVLTPYITYWTKGTKDLDLSLLTKVNKLIYRDLRKIVMAKFDDGYNGLTVSTNVTKMFYGNQNMPIYQKIKEAAEWQGNSREVIYDIS